MLGKLASATVSVVIPTKNAGAGFRETLEAIRSQTMPSEIVVVDSGSSDGTVEMASQFGASVIAIAPESFNHGETRNLGIRNSKGQFCVMLVQDALPVGSAWLDALIEPFFDERVVGVTVRQTPRRDSDPVGRWQVEYRNQFLGDAVLVQELENWNRFLDLDFQQRLRLASFDNVCSAIRREFWETSPFQAVAFAEDLDWAIRALAARRLLVYNPSVCVIHSHNRPAAYHLRRSYLSGRVVPKILHLQATDPGIRDDEEFLDLLGSVYGEVHTMLHEGIGDWRSFRRTSCADRGFWRDFLTAVGLRPSPPYNYVRDTFYFVVEQLEGVCRRSQPPAPSSYMAVHALAQSIGSFAAEYYNWCEAKDILSDNMRRLDQALSTGV